MDNGGGDDLSPPMKKWKCRKEYGKKVAIPAPSATSGKSIATDEDIMKLIHRHYNFETFTFLEPELWALLFTRGWMKTSHLRFIAPWHEALPLEDRRPNVDYFETIEDVISYLREYGCARVAEIERERTIDHIYKTNKYSPNEKQEPDKIKEDFCKNHDMLMRTLLSDLTTVPYVDIMNAAKILDILKGTKKIKNENENENDNKNENENDKWHWFYTKDDKVWCRRKEIKLSSDLKKFKEGEDYFHSDMAALNFVHGQLTARGHNLKTLGQCALACAVRRGVISKSVEKNEKKILLNCREERMKKRQRQGQKQGQGHNQKQRVSKVPSNLLKYCSQIGFVFTKSNKVPIK